jgi:Multidrug resistance efflux pump
MILLKRQRKRKAYLKRGRENGEKKKIVAAIIAAAVLLSGYLGWEYFYFSDDGTVEASGTIEATTVDLRVMIAGKVQNFQVKSGDKVKKADIIAEIQRNDLAAQLERDKLNVAIAQNNLDALPSGSSDHTITAAQDQVMLMQAVVKATEAQLADLQIKSPIDGTIQAKDYEIGEYVTAGSTLATVVNLDQVWINVYIPTDDLPFIELGREANFTISGLDRVFTGTIAEIASQGEFTPKTIQTKRERANIVYKVKIAVDNPEGLLKPGMPADVMIKMVETAND